MDIPTILSFYTQWFLIDKLGSNSLEIELLFYVFVSSLNDLHLCLTFSSSVCLRWIYWLYMSAFSVKLLKETLQSSKRSQRQEIRELWKDLHKCFQNMTDNSLQVILKLGSIPNNCKAKQRTLINKRYNNIAKDRINRWVSYFGLCNENKTQKKNPFGFHAT